MDKGNLARTAELLSRNYSAPQLEANCSDGSEFTFDSIDQLFDYENPNYRRIESITITFGDRNDGGRIHLSSDTFASYRVYIHDTDDARAYLVANEIEMRLKSCKPSYSALTRLPSAAYLGIPIAGFFVVYYWIDILKDGILVTRPLSVSHLYVVLPIVLIAAMLLRILDRAWQWLFPKAWFSLGKQQNEHRRRSQVRTRLLIGSAMTIGLGIASNILTRWIIAT